MLSSTRVTSAQPSFITKLLEHNSQLTLADPVIQFILKSETDPVLRPVYQALFPKGAPEEAYSIFSILKNNINNPKIKQYLQLIINDILSTNKRQTLLTASNLQWIFDTIISEPPYRTHSLTILHALFALSDKTTLNQEIIDKLQAHTQLDSLKQSIQILWAIDLLTPQTFALLADFEHIIPLQRFLSNFMSHRIERWQYLNHINTTQLMVLLKADGIHPLLSTEGLALIARIPHYTRESRGREIWSELFACCAQPEPLNALEVYVAQYIEPDSDEEDELDINAEVGNINNSQSTHTASVHKSVSESVLRLKDSYPQALESKQQDQNIQALIDYVDSLSATNTKEKAVKNFVAKLAVGDPIFQFVDPVSKVSTYQLLSLVWVAMHDPSKYEQEVTESSLLQSMTDHFEYIQREYSSDNEQARDLCACTSGTFNQVTDILNAYHKDVDILYITKKIAAAKLQIVVRDSLDQFLSAEQSKLESQQFQTLLLKLDEHGLDNTEETAIWLSIKDEISEKMQEFNVEDLYTPEAFELFIEQAKHFNVTPLIKKYTNLKGELASSSSIASGQPQAVPSPTELVEEPTLQQEIPSRSFSSNEAEQQNSTTEESTFNLIAFAFDHPETSTSVILSLLVAALVIAATVLTGSLSLTPAIAVGAVSGISAGTLSFFAMNKSDPADFDNGKITTINLMQ